MAACARSHLCVRGHIRVGAVEQEEVLHGQIVALQLGAQLEGHAGPKGVAGDAIGPDRLHLPHAARVVGCQGLDALQGGSWGATGGSLDDHMVGDVARAAVVASVTLRALQAVARHAQPGGQSPEGGDGALDGMDQEERPLLALDVVERRHCGAAGVDQQEAEIRLQRRADAAPLRRCTLTFWIQREEYHWVRLKSGFPLGVLEESYRPGRRACCWPARAAC